MARELEGLRSSAQPRELENVDSKAFRIGVNTAVAAPSIREYSDVGLPYNVRKKGAKVARKNGGGEGILVSICSFCIWTDRDFSRSLLTIDRNSSHRADVRA